MGMGFYSKKNWSRGKDLKYLPDLGWECLFPGNQENKPRLGCLKIGEKGGDFKVNRGKDHQKIK